MRPLSCFYGVTLEAGERARSERVTRGRVCNVLPESEGRSPVVDSAGRASPVQDEY